MKNWISLPPFFLLLFSLITTGLFSQDILDNCRKTVAQGKFLCADDSENGMITIHTLNNDGNLQATKLDETGNILTSNAMGALINEQYEIEGNQLIKTDAKGTILWQKTIPVATLAAHNNIEVVQEMSNGTFLFGGFEEFYSPDPHFYEETLYFLELDQDLNLIQKVEGYKFTYYYTYGLSLFAIVPEANGQFTAIFSSINPFSIVPIPLLVLKRFDAQFAEVDRTNLEGFIFEAFYLTPCDNFLIEGRIQLISQKGSYFGDNSTWIDPVDFSIIQNLNVGKGSIDYYGSYDYYLFNANERSDTPFAADGSIKAGLPLSNPYYQGPIPTFMDIHLISGDTRNAIQIPYVPFEYIVQTGDYSALVIDENNSTITVFDTDCIKLEDCTLEVEILEVQCVENDPNLDESADKWVVDIMVEGDDNSTWRIGTSYNNSSAIGINSEFFEGLPFNIPQRLFLPKSYDSFTIERQSAAACAERIVFTQEDCSAYYDGRPDLNLSNPNPPVYYQKQGDVFQFTFNIHNDGEGVAEGDFVIKSYLSKDQFISADDYQDGIVPTGNFPAEFSVSNVTGAMTIDPSLPVGNYVLLLEIDSENTIEEANEYNNVLIAGYVFLSEGTVEPEDYCEISSEFPWEEWISNVQIGSASNESGKAKYSLKEQALIQLQKGANVPWQIEATFSYFTFKEYCSIYIDYNGNGVFENTEIFARDVVYPPADGSNVKGIISGMGTIPFNAVTGEVRMRVLMQRNEYADPCEDLTFGEVEDYVVELVPAGQNFGLIYNQVPTINYQVYPNPTFDGIHVDLSHEKETTVQLQVVDCLGKIRFKKEINSREQSSQWIDMTSWNAAYYDLQIIEDGRVLKHEAIIKID